MGSGVVLVGSYDFYFLCFYMKHNKEAKSLTFWRGSEVSQVHRSVGNTYHNGIPEAYDSYTVQYRPPPPPGPILLLKASTIQYCS